LTRPARECVQVLMTSAAMIAGMVPMALALGEGAQAAAPLGRAVIGGLAAADDATLIVLPSVYSLVQSGARDITIAGSRRPRECVSECGFCMTMLTTVPSPRAYHLCSVLVMIAAAACGGSGAATSGSGATAAADPMTVDVANVVEQPLNVELSLPGELTAFQSVAIHPRVAGFVKAVHVDRGSRVRAGDVLVTLDAPEVIAQRAEAQSKLQGAEAQFSVARAKAEADRGTYEKLKAASATSGSGRWQRTW
jgi:hypothetical protein